jgi:glycosyltransferase involved in cell wall biosynthesis
MKVAWLCAYPLTLLQPELTLVRDPKAHPGSWIVNLATMLAEREDIDLHIITASSGISKSQAVTKFAITFNVIRHTFPCSNRGFPRYLRLDLLTAYSRLRLQIKKLLIGLRPDLIHVHGTEYCYGLAALDAHFPAIVSIQGIVGELARTSRSLSLQLQSRLEDKVLRKARYFGTRTAWANRVIRARNSAATIYEFPEAINPSFFKPVSERSGQDILMVGEIVRRKGVEDALHAMCLVTAALPSARLVLVGDGPAAYVQQLKAFSRSTGIASNVEWLGFKQTREVAELHRTATILIHPSHIDNSPNSVAEAMASGLPVIASDVGGIPSMIEDGVTGVLVPPDDPQELAAKIISLLRDGAERNRLATRARSIALERHCPSKVAARAMQVYRDILSKKQDMSP